MLCSPHESRRYQIRSYELYPLLGFKSVIPKDYEGEHFVRTTGKAYRVRVERTQPGSYAKHRIRVLCECGQWVPYGRQMQHARGRRHCDATL